MARVERLKHYASIKPEGVLRGADAGGSGDAHVTAARHGSSRTSAGALVRPARSWPRKGAVEFRDVWLKYRKGLPPVLKGVSFSVPAGCTAALVGRTGSGKSTTLAALFRSALTIRGRVLIDGVDTASMGLHDLRDRLAIVPQDGAVISGTIRSVLSPQGPDPRLGPKSLLSPLVRDGREAAAGSRRERREAAAGPKGAPNPTARFLELGLAHSQHRAEMLNFLGGESAAVGRGRRCAPPFLPFPLAAR